MNDSTRIAILEKVAVSLEEQMASSKKQDTTDNTSRLRQKARDVQTGKDNRAKHTEGVRNKSYNQYANKRSLIESQAGKKSGYEMLASRLPGEGRRTATLRNQIGARDAKTNRLGQAYPRAAQEFNAQKATNKKLKTRDAAQATQAYAAGSGPTQQAADGPVGPTRQRAAAPGPGGIAGMMATARNQMATAGKPAAAALAPGGAPAGAAAAAPGPQGVGNRGGPKGPSTNPATLAKGKPNAWDAMKGKARSAMGAPAAGAGANMSMPGGGVGRGQVGGAGQAMPRPGAPGAAGTAGAAAPPQSTRPNRRVPARGAPAPAQAPGKVFGQAGRLMQGSKTYDFGKKQKPARRSRRAAAPAQAQGKVFGQAGRSLQGAKTMNFGPPKKGPSMFASSPSAANGLARKDGPLVSRSFGKPTNPRPVVKAPIRPAARTTAASTFAPKGGGPRMGINGGGGRPPVKAPIKSKTFNFKA